MKTNIITAALFLCAFTVDASEVFYSPLSNVVQEARWIIKGTVLSVTTNDYADVRGIEYKIEPYAVLTGIPTTPRNTLLAYEQSIPVFRDKDGNIVGWASPIYSGSGHEFSIKPDEKWIFLLISNSLSETTPTPILRAEPISSEPEIMKILSQQSGPAYPPQGVGSPEP